METFSPAGYIRHLATMWAAKHPYMDDRMERAIALTGNITQLDKYRFRVEGVGGTYNVRVNYRRKTSTCSCPDSRKGFHCKHALAVALVYVTEREMNRRRIAASLFNTR